jgi:putative acetyltransferase
MTAMRRIVPGDFDDDRVKALLARHLAGMHANSPPGHVFALDWSALQQPEISFYALWEDDEARRRGYARLSLETGSGPAFEPALELYRKYGFTEGDAFDDYEKSPFNRFLHLDLVSTSELETQSMRGASRRRLAT